MDIKWAARGAFLTLGVLALTVGIQPAEAVTAASWQPGPAAYGVSQPQSVAVTMDQLCLRSTAARNLACCRR